MLCKVGKLEFCFMDKLVYEFKETKTKISLPVHQNHMTTNYYRHIIQTPITCNGMVSKIQSIMVPYKLIRNN